LYVLHEHYLKLRFPNTS